MKFIPENFDPSQLSPLNLAFVGDTVFDMFIREGLVIEANRPVKKLQSIASTKVNAASQAEYAKKIENVLTEEEQGVFRRGKNAHVNHFPKNMSREDYHLATAVEALYGYLFLKGDILRLEELFEMFE